MNIESLNGRHIFILDTNVLIHDPSAIFMFMEHDLFIPMVVLEELDSAKKGMSEVARNARQASRFLDELMTGATRSDIKRGLPLPGPKNGEVSEDCKHGRLFFQTRNMPFVLPEGMPNIPDNNILGVGLTLKEEYSDSTVVLISKDINLRIKSAVLGLHAEDYSNDKVLDDVNLLYKGHLELPANFWDEHSKNLKSWNEKDGRSFYRVDIPDIDGLHISQCLSMDGDDSFRAIVRELDDRTAIFEILEDHHVRSVWGINARNREQNFALNMLLDQELDFVSLLGVAGTGKTLLTLAAGLAQVLDQNIYREIIMTRATVPLGDDIGFLPGTEEEKMAPWMGALKDNLEVLTQPKEGGEWGKAATDDLLRNRIRIHSLNFMRGRTFLNKYIIIDEAQNLTSKQMVALITRAGPGTKVVCLGNVAQIDTPYLTETTSGLTYAVDRFKNWRYSGHVTLLQGERSRLADFANKSL